MPTPYTQLIAGTQEVSTTLIYLKSDAGELEALTPLMLADDGEFKKWDGTESGKALYLTTSKVKASEKQAVQVYKTGIFNIDAIAWPESVTTAQKKTAAFAGSGVSVQPLAR